MKAINQEFKFMQGLNVAIPGLPVGTDIVIWEGERQNPTPTLSPSGQNVGRWVMPDERIDYQGFASPFLYSHTKQCI